MAFGAEIFVGSAFRGLKTNWSEIESQGINMDMEGRYVGG